MFGLGKFAAKIKEKNINIRFYDEHRRYRNRIIADLNIDEPTYEEMVSLCLTLYLLAYRLDVLSKDKIAFLQKPGFINDFLDRISFRESEPEKLAGNYDEQLLLAQYLKKHPLRRCSTRQFLQVLMVERNQKLENLASDGYTLYLKAFEFLLSTWPRARGIENQKLTGAKDTLAGWFSALQCIAIDARPASIR